MFSSFIHGLKGGLESYGTGRLSRLSSENIIIVTNGAHRGHSSAGIYIACAVTPDKFTYVLIFIPVTCSTARAEQEIGLHV